MRLLEHQAKRLVAAAGIAVPDGDVAAAPELAASIARQLAGPVVVKAQVRAGARGKAGGVLRAASPAEAAAAARHLLGSQLSGLAVRQVLVERAVPVSRELYLGVSIDYDRGQPVLLLGSEGGVDVEFSAHNGAASASIPVASADSITEAVGRRLLEGSRLSLSLQPAILHVARALGRVFFEHEAILAEINPLAVLDDGRLVALDARLTLDPAALSRHPELERLTADAGADDTVEERIKREHDFDFVVLDPDGEVGLLSTGAGLTMMTVDLVQRLGGRPFNFADVRTGRLGGDPGRLVVTLRELQRAPRLRCVLVSVFGALTEMDEFARLLCRALDEAPLGVPMLARVQGRKKDLAQASLRERGLRCFDDLEEAVSAAVAIVRAGDR